MRTSHIRYINELLAAASLLAVSCTDDSLVNDKTHQQDPSADQLASPVLFSVGQDNSDTRATLLQDAGHFNFGVFGYKSNDATNPVFQNYLVGYYDEARAYGTPVGSTFGDPSGDTQGVSYWMYEGMGADEYTGTYAGQPLTDAFRSNLPHQYMRYWDKESASTSFYAYAPYVHGEQTATFDNQTKLLTLPAGSMHDGYEDRSLYEYLYGTTTVQNVNYGNDVYLPFRRLNCKVNIRFYEEIPGYTVQILDLGNSYLDVQATPAVRTGSEGNYSYTDGKYYTSAGASVNFSATEPAISQISPVAHPKGETLVFAEPADSIIGTTAESSTPSPTTYYGIPKDLETGGFTFHVTYRLTSDMNEQITVRNATAFVPADKCNWRPNTAYTYIFKITRETNGSTDPDDEPGIDPSDPDVNPDAALYPIVFDSCTVEEWTQAEESEHELGK